MKKRKLVTFTVLLLVAVMVLSVTGCSQKAEQPAPSDQSPGEQAAPPAEKVELVMGHPFGAMHPVSQQILIPLAEELKEKSNGRITLTIHAGGAVTSPATIREDVAIGAIDIGWTLQGYTPGKYPMTDVVELPFQYDSTEQASYVLWNLYKQSPEFQKDYSDVKVLGLWTTDPGEFLSKGPITKPEDLTGMRIRFSGSAQETMIKKFGGTPVGLAMPDVYDSLQRGVIDGVAVGTSVVDSYKLNEVISYATNGLNSFYSSQVIFMNQDKWNSLSPEDQELLSSLTGEVILQKGIEIYNDEAKKGLEKATAEPDITINTITPEQRKEWKEKTTSVVDEWLESVNSKGYDGQAVLDMSQKFAEEYNEKSK